MPSILQMESILQYEQYLAGVGAREVHVASVLLVLLVAVEDAHWSSSIPPLFHYLLKNERDK